MVGIFWKIVVAELCSCICSARGTLARTVQLAMTEALTNDTRQEANTALLEVDKGQSPADLSGVVQLHKCNTCNYPIRVAVNRITTAHSLLQAVRDYRLHL